MTHDEAYFTTRDGRRLFERCWLPEGEPRATVVVVHGINEHSGRYARLADDLCRRGFAVYALDLRGHGKSDGPRVWINRFDEYLGDVEVLLGRVAVRQPKKPLFLFGHSMGGAIVALFGIERLGDCPNFRQEDRHSCLSKTASLTHKMTDRNVCPPGPPPELAGLILSAPAVLVGAKVFPILRRLASFVSRVWPNLRLVKMGSRFISHDRAVVEAFRNDPLVFHGRIPVRTGAEILQAAQRIQRNAARLTLPLLILHGTGDFATDHNGSRLLYALAGSVDKTLCLYPGLYHEVFSEPERDKPLADLVKWLEERTQ